MKYAIAFAVIAGSTLLGVTAALTPVMLGRFVLWLFGGAL